MARFLLTTMPGAGCVAPALPVAAALVRRGHEVWWHTGAERAAQVAATGATFIPFDRTLSWDDLRPAPDPGQRGFAAVNTMMRKFLVDRALGQLADYETILAGTPVDVVITDGSCLGVHMLHDRGGPPWAMIHDTALIGICPDDPPHGSGHRPPRSGLGRLRNRALTWVARHLALRPLTESYQQLRARVGLPPLPRGQTVFDALVSPYLYLQPTSPAFEYPRRHLPPQVHLVGPLVPDGPVDFDPPSWWPELDRVRPVIHLTQGTTETDLDDLVRPAIRGLAGEPGLVVVTATGTEPPADLPANVRFAPYIPHRELLPKVDVMVTNGGYNGVLAALSHGVPLVASGWRIDHPEVCSRIAWSGAGIWVKGRNPAPEALRTAVRRVLDDPGYRAGARRIAADFAGCDGPTTAAELLERLAASRSPVLSRG